MCSGRQEYWFFFFNCPTIKVILGTVSKCLCPIGHFRVHLSLHFKARLSAKSLLWKSVFIHIEIRTNYHNKNFALRVALKERLRGTRKWPIVQKAININLGLNSKQGLNFAILLVFSWIYRKDWAPNRGWCENIFSDANNKHYGIVFPAWASITS